MSTAAHRALEVEEVLATVFRHLSPYVWDRLAVLTAPDSLDIDRGKDFIHLGIDAQPNVVNQHALAQCARVSRTFAPHALKVLWRTLPNPRPLQHLLDIMHISYDDPAADMPIHTFPFSIKPTTRVREWQRYRWYASCVVGVRSVVDYSAFEEWSDIGGPPVLPRLQSARFHIDPRSINRTLRLLGPTLRDLTLNFDSSSSQFREHPRLSTAEVLTTAARLAPATEVLNVTFKAPPKDLLPVLPQFSRLRVLIVTGWMTPSLHQAIVALEFLEMLYVKLYWTRHAEAGMQNLQLLRCRSIKTLVALTLSEPILAALQATEFPSLERVRLEVWPHSSDATEGLTQIMETLHKHAPKLHSFVLTARSAAAHGDLPPPRLATVVAPFLAHAALETLSLTLEDNYAFALTRTDILSFAAAWPNIVTLHLAHAPSRSADPLPPIVSVLELVSACPRLETLVLCGRFDCTARASWRDAAIAPHPLNGLFLGLDAETGSYRPDKTWRALAAVLVRCFPNLDTERELVRTSSVGAQAMELWRGVLHHVREIRAGGRRSLSPPEL